MIPGNIIGVVAGNTVLQWKMPPSGILEGTFTHDFPPGEKAFP